MKLPLLSVKKTFWRLQIYLFGWKIWSCRRGREIERIYKRRFEGLTEEEIRKVIEWQYYTIAGRWPDMDHPKTFTEKLQWIKWRRRDPLMVRLSDKVAVRDFIRERGCGQYLIPALGIWESAEAVDFNALPEKFAIKVNWGCQQNIICTDKAKLDIEEARRKLHAWMMPHANHYYSFLEWAYKGISPKIIAEEFMDDGHGLRDFKFYCFAGEPTHCFVCDGRESGETTYTTFDLDFNRLDVTLGGMKRYAGRLEKPVAWDEMLEVCRKLSKGIPFVRVDLYDVRGRVMVGELTCYPGAGWAVPDPISLDFEMGKLLPIPELGEK